MDLSQRFWSKVRKSNGCWEWTSAIHRDGYGVFGVYRPEDRERLGLSTHNARAHRVAYALAKGPCPAGALILHSCDNPRCVNPDHLSAGTASQNTIEALERGRMVPMRGERSGSAKLTTRQVIAIRARRATTGERYRDIAADLPVTESQVEAICNRRTWKHV